MKFEIPVLSKITVGWTGDLLLKHLGSALEWLLEMRFCPAHVQLIRDIVKEHTRLACEPSEVEAWLARTEGSQLHSADARADLDRSNLHAGPDFAKASSRQAAYAPVHRDVHAEVEILTGGFIPTPLHFSDFEESFLDRSVEIHNLRHGPSLFEVPYQQFARDLHFQKTP